MNKIKSIIGLGFGDEGKGLVTDYESERTNNPLIIRHSGGQQAGHNVVLDNVSHIFSNFGSGTLRGIPTYWSNFCSTDPIGLINELNVLKDKNINPIIYIDGDSPITTPYEKFHNKNNDKDIDHGTCGLGVGSTFKREDDFYHLSFSDLFNHWILENKLNYIKGYYNNINLDDELISFLISCYEVIKSPNINITYGIPSGYDNYIFESSQGLLLDQHYGFFPHVARSNTGTKNILKILNNDIIDIDLYLVTRAYQTRHGNGPMTNTNYDIDINNHNETNVNNKYQGEFRKSILDVSLLEYGINKDKYIRESDNKTLVITCLDHLTEYSFTYNGDLIVCKNEKEFVEKISDILNIKNVLISKSNESKNIEKYK